MIAVSHGRATSAEAEQLTLGAFLKLLILPILLHLFPLPDLMDRFAEKIAHFALETPAGHHGAVGLDGEMAVAAMATVVDCLRIAVFRYLEQSLLVEEECPEMIFEIEDCARILILLEFLPYPIEEIAIFHR